MFLRWFDMQYGDRTPCVAPIAPIISFLDRLTESASGVADRENSLTRIRSKANFFLSALFCVLSVARIPPAEADGLCAKLEQFAQVLYKRGAFTQFYFLQTACVYIRHPQPLKHLHTLPPPRVLHPRYYAFPLHPELDWSPQGFPLLNTITKLSPPKHPVSFFLSSLLTGSLITFPTCLGYS